MMQEIYFEELQINAIKLQKKYLLKSLGSDCQELGCPLSYVSFAISRSNRYIFFVEDIE